MKPHRSLVQSAANIFRFLISQTYIETYEEFEIGFISKNVHFSHHFLTIYIEFQCFNFQSENRIDCIQTVLLIFFAIRIFLIASVKHSACEQKRARERQRSSNTKYKLLLMRASSIINKFSSSLCVQLECRVQLHVLDEAVRRRILLHITTNIVIFTFFVKMY